MSTDPIPWWKQTETATTLVGIQCKQCNRAFFPPRSTCPACSSKALDWIDLPALGHLVTWTVTRVVPEEHDEKELVLGLADFGGALVLAKIRGVEGVELEKDFQLVVKLDPTPADPSESGYSFHFVASKTGENTDH